MISKNVLGIVVSFAAALCWGLVYAQVQNLDAKLSPIAILSLFYICAAVAMTPFAAFQIPRLTGKLRQNYREFFICLLATITAEIFIFYSIELLGGTDASLIEVRSTLVAFTARTLSGLTGYRHRCHIHCGLD